LTGSIRNLQAQLAGEDASAHWPRALPSLPKRGNTMMRWLSGGATTACCPRSRPGVQADDAANAAQVELGVLQRKLAQLEKEIADKQNRAAREEQMRRVQKLRDNRRKMPAAC